MKDIMNKNNDSRVKNSTYNIFFGMLNKVVIMLLTFVSRAIFLRVLSEDYLGINSLFSSILNMLSLADLGLGTAMAYSFYKPLAEKDEKKIASLIAFYKKVYNYIAAAVAIVGICIIPFLDYIVKTDQDIPYLKVYYFVFLMNTVVSYLFVYKSTIISADQKGYIISQYSIWVNVAKLVVQTVILYTTHNYLCYILVTVFATLANNFILSYKVDKMYPYLKKGEQPSAEERKSIFNNVGSVFLYKLSHVLLTATDDILISTIVSTAAVGFYTNYRTITVNLEAISSIIFNALTASVGNLIVKEKEERRYQIFRIMQMASFWISGFFSVCTLYLTQDFIRLWLGDRYVMSEFTLLAIVLNFYLGLCLPPIWSFREATGLYQKTKYIMLLTAGVNIVLSIILGQKFGIAGIVLATFLSKILTYFWYEPRLLYREYFGKKCGEYYLGHVTNVIMMAALIFILQKIDVFRTIDSWGALIGRGIITAIVVNVAYFLRYFWTKEFKELFNKLVKMVKKSN